MSLFAEYDPKGNRPPLKDLEIGRAEARDVAALSELTMRREGLARDEVEPRFRREVEVDPNTHCLLVARSNGRTLAFARASFYARPEDASPDHQPEGWYLSGVIVDEEYRRRGIAKALCEARLEFVAQRANEVFYIANVRNRPSIELHAKLGFEELTREFYSPRVTYTGGAGALFRLELHPRPSQRSSG